MTKNAIAQHFSNGRFELTNEHIAEDAVWEIVGESRFDGKNAIIDNCSKVEAYFASVTTHFTTLSVITEDNKVAVSGNAEFIRDNVRVSSVSACDLYVFNNENQIQSITSYCIQLQ